ncbi:MAG TPA: hypothetical protein VL475_02125, partial [Planctomycetaceae bacterium]|nr:hypothetical protein [Planctomycetaceae bacterium]
MSRRWQRPAAGFGRRNPRTQLLSMLIFLVILGLIYARARDPQTWRWLADDRAAGPDLQQMEANANAPAADGPAAADDTVVPGPTDEDAEEMADATRQFAAISDKAPLDKSEMPAYWRLMKWARGQSFKDLAARARRDVLYTQLWERPHAYRGKLLKLRLHIKRVVEWDAPENVAGVKTVYEAWGWTDESKSYPYVVVFSELPQGMHVGADVQ